VPLKNVSNLLNRDAYVGAISLYLIEEAPMTLFGTDYFKGAFVGIQILWNATVERICCEIKLSV
jgi:hypothetical protein